MPDRLNPGKLTRRIALGTAALLATCCAPAPTPTPPVTVKPAPTPTYTPPPVVTEPEYENYLDAPQTPGDWTYSPGMEGGGTASFGANTNAPLFEIECRHLPRRLPVLTLYRSGSANGAVPMRIRTETQERLLSVTQDISRPGTLSVLVNPTDPLLDAIGFSRGRFAVEVSGLRTLYIPAWPEITRVIEDCR